MQAIPLPEPPLSDGVVALRPWAQDDVPWIAEACRDPEIPRWTAVPDHYREQDARQYVAGAEPARVSGLELGLAITDAEGGEPLGSIGLTRLDREGRKAEIGYWMASWGRRRSYGKRAARLLSEWALRRLELDRIELMANPLNAASQRLAESAGFAREGLLRSYRPRKGVREDLVMFSLLRSDLS